MQHIDLIYSLKTMNAKLVRILQYIFIPFVFAAIGYGLVYIGVSGGMSLMKDTFQMALVKGAPDYPNDFNKAYYEFTVADKEENQSEVLVPGYGVNYGMLSCEDKGLQAPVYYGDDTDILAKGVGQYTGSALFGEGKPILIGGHDSTYFKELGNLEAGDTILVQTNYGKYEYKVTGTKVGEVLDPDNFDLTTGKEELTLYTCYPLGIEDNSRTQRYFVYARLVQ